MRVHLAAIGQEISRPHLAAIGCNGLIKSNRLVCPTFAPEGVGGGGVVSGACD